MKKILVTGASSYIGRSFIDYLRQWPEEYAITTLSLRGEAWRSFDFSPYDVVYHLVGVAHRKETKENAWEYYSINRDLAVETAQMAKAAGVKQFLFLSTSSIYGMESGVITKDTVPHPKTNYGKAKLQAEQVLLAMGCDSFRVAILRPMLVYGKDCRGNFQKVLKLVRKSPVFPRIHNRRSLIYIDNLSAFVKLAIDRQLDGIYFPRDRENVDTFAIAQGTARAMGKGLYMSWLLGAALWLGRDWFAMTRKAFGDLTYEDTEEFDYEYCVVPFDEAISRSV